MARGGRRARIANQGLDDLRDEDAPLPRVGRLEDPEKNLKRPPRKGPYVNQADAVCEIDQTYVYTGGGGGPPSPAATGVLADRTPHFDDSRLFGGFDVGPTYLAIGPGPGLVM
jgi:hypothetical protein